MTDAAINYNYMMIFLKDLNNFIKKYQTILTKIKKKTYNYLIKLFLIECKMQKLNYKPIEYFGNISNEQEIERLNVYIFNMEQEIESLKETITNLQKPRNNYNIVNNIQQLLIQTEGTEHQEIIIERLQALYKMNINIKL